MRGSSSILNRPPPASLRAASAAFWSSAPSTIVRNLSISNGGCRPMRRCRNSTGPRESSLIASAIAAQQRRQHEQAERRRRRGRGALEHLRRAREPVAAHAQQRDAVDLVELDRRAHHLEQPRQHAHLHSRKRLHEPDRVEDVVGVALARRDDHPVDLLRRRRRARAFAVEAGTGSRSRPRAPAEAASGPDDARLQAAALVDLARRIQPRRRGRPARGIAPRPTAASRAPGERRASRPCTTNKSPRARTPGRARTAPRR